MLWNGIVSKDFFKVMDLINCTKKLQVFCASGLIIPQLEDPEIGFGISKEDGSWLGKEIRVHNHIGIS